ncbi:hypothetical protein WJU23_18900 [Prosthecobacter sp. SYSU 5D2]|uniref:hypothetical protein n=1 Tax=Prosthecobacter sp. SYSU 5D2 TaxID=3134134 RepID=UPI0031FE5C51
MTTDQLDKIVDEIAPDLIAQSSNRPEIADADLYRAYMDKGFIGRFREDELVMDKLAKDCARQMDIQGKGNIALIEKALTEQYIKQPLMASIEADKFKIRKMEKSDDPAAHAALPAMKEALADKQLSLNLVNQRMASLETTVRLGGPADAARANAAWVEEESQSAGNQELPGADTPRVSFDDTAVEVDGNVEAKIKTSHVKAHLAARMLDELARDPTLGNNDVIRHLKNNAPAQLGARDASSVKTEFSALIQKSNAISEQIAKLEQKINNEGGWTVDARTRERVEGQIQALQAEQNQLFTDVQAQAAQDIQALHGQKAILDRAAQNPAQNNPDGGWKSARPSQAQSVRDEMRPLKSALKSTAATNSLDAAPSSSSNALDAGASSSSNAIETSSSLSSSLNDGSSSSSNSVDADASVNSNKTKDNAVIQWTRTAPTQAPGLGLGNRK